jgi:cytochrome c
VRVIGFAIAVTLIFFAVAGGGLRDARAQDVAPNDAEMPAPEPTPLALGLLPSVSMQAIPSYGNAPLTVGFLVNAVDPEDVGFARYAWNFGNGNVSTLPPILVYETYQTPGSYTVTLTVITIDGRSASAMIGVVATQPAAN